MPVYRIPDLSVVYLDANILITHFSYSIKNPHRDTIKCLNLMKDIEPGRIFGLVSTAALLETIDVMKREYADKLGASPSTADLNKLEEAILAKLSHLGIKVSDLDESILRENSILILQRARFFIMNTEAYLGSDKKWHSIGLMDAIHCGWAERECTHLITRDIGLRNAPSKAKPVLLWEAY